MAAGGFGGGDVYLRGPPSSELSSGRLALSEHTHGCSVVSKSLDTQCSDKRPSPESSPLVGVSGGRAEAQRSRPERPALSKERRRAGEGLWTPGVGVLSLTQEERGTLSLPVGTGLARP